MASDGYVGGEPTAEEAAQLVAAIMGAGTVGRLDMVHAALRSAFARGRADVRESAIDLCRQTAQRFTEEIARVTEEHAELFVSTVTARAQADEQRDALPWVDRLRAV